MIKDGIRENWIGEPSSVMVRRECFEKVGGFSLHVRQATDLDLWLRLMAHYEVGLIDAELNVYRHSQASLTAVNKRRRMDWLDRLWILEGLWSYETVVRDYPELARELRAERRMARRTVLATLLGRQHAAPHQNVGGIPSRSRGSPSAVRAN